MQLPRFHTASSRGLDQLAGISGAGRTRWGLILMWVAATFASSAPNLSNVHNFGDQFDPSLSDMTDMISGSLSHEVSVIAAGTLAVFSLFLTRRKIDLSNRLLTFSTIAFAIWSGLSIAWATDFELTFKRFIAFGLYCLVALAIATELSLRELLSWILCSSGAFVAANMAIGIRYGTLRLPSADYRFGGAVHPNVLSVDCAVLILATIVAADLSKGRFLLTAIIRFSGLGGVLCLVLTGSRTSIGALLMSICLYLWLVKTPSQKLYTYLLGICIGGSVFCATALFNNGTVFHTSKDTVDFARVSAGRDTMDARGNVWKEMVTYSSQRLVLGYGFNGFWDAHRIEDISEHQGWVIPNSHDAYLDILLETGLVGLAFCLSSVFGALHGALRMYALHREREYVFASMLLLFCIVHGISESGTKEVGHFMLFATAIIASMCLQRNCSNRPQV